MRNNAVRVIGDVAYIDLAVPVTIAELERQLTEAEQRGARRVEFVGKMAAPAVVDLDWAGDPPKWS